MNSSAISSIEKYFLDFIIIDLLNPNNKHLIKRKTASELCILSIIHQLLIKNMKSTKRNIFYMNIELFVNQKYLDFIIECISKKIGLSRIEMNIEASSKSLIYGDVMLNHRVNEPIHCLSSHNGINLSSGFTFSQKGLKLIKFILVVEKDATFQNLIDRNFCSLFNPSILITAKGFPDLNCRFLLNSRDSTIINIPVFCLVDADPFGLSIYCSFKYGSKKFSLLDANQDIIRSHNMKLIGLLATDIEKLQFQKNEILTLSPADKRILVGIQNEKFYMTDSDVKLQVECFSRLQAKAEIQSLDNLGTDYLIKEYLYKKLICYGISPSIFF
uniref:DNA topoisomerase (ATP-hydrolyzing) n=1 Tax=Schmidtea mediterranea TaxID=79327 RepID=A0A0A0V782_SCHMD|nr:Spo11 [Schmidtea mediterranea]